MSNFNVANSLKGKSFSSSLFAPNALRKGLIVVQFSIAIAVFIALLVVHSQLNYLDNKDLGYNKDQLIHIGLRSWEGKGEAFKTELKNISGVEAVSIAGWDPRTGSPSMSMTGDHPNKEGEKFEIGFIMADFDFVETLGMSLEDGRILDPQYGNDAYSPHELWSIDPKSQGEYINSRSVLVNHSTAKMLGINTLNENIKGIGYTPVGILKDFHTESLHKALEPVFILGQNNPDYAYMFIRITPGQEEQVLPAISQTWRQFYPDKLLDATWVADILQKQYSAEQKQRTLFMLFSGLMLFLSSLGVLGLIMHTAELRVKEIGIRKVLGASVAGIVRMLSGDFVKLVLIAVLIASPIAWWAMNKWLEDFAYRIEIQWWMFALAGMMAVGIALLTVSFQAVKAAVANPVDSLRDE